MQSGKDEKTGKNRTISARFSAAERIKVREKADTANLCVSEYLRRCALSRKISSDPNMEVLKELHRIAMLLKQLAGPASIDHAQINAVINELRDVFERLCK